MKIQRENIFIISLLLLCVLIYTNLMVNRTIQMYITTNELEKCLKKSDEFGVYLYDLMLFRVSMVFVVFILFGLFGLILFIYVQNNIRTHSGKIKPHYGLKEEVNIFGRTISSMSALFSILFMCIVIYVVLNYFINNWKDSYVKFRTSLEPDKKKILNRLQKEGELTTDISNRISMYYNQIVKQAEKTKDITYQLQMMQYFNTILMSLVVISLISKLF